MGIIKDDVMFCSSKKSVNFGDPGGVTAPSQYVNTALVAIVRHHYNLHWSLRMSNNKI